MTKRFQDKAVLVTGAASGIGRASALAFAGEGANVVAVDWNEEKNEATALDIQQQGGKAVAFTADVSQFQDCEAMVNGTVKTYGRLDIAFNNAGIAGPLGIDLEKTPEEDWNKVMSVNLTGMFLAMKAEIPVMKKQGGGVIVNTASVAGIIGTKKVTTYTAAKHGVVGLTKAAALEAIEHNIRINAICPGATMTEMLQGAFDSPGMKEIMMSMQPIGRVAQPEEIAKMVLFLASEDAAFMVGHALVADGGLATG